MPATSARLWLLCSRSSDVIFTGWILLIKNKIIDPHNLLWIPLTVKIDPSLFGLFFVWKALFLGIFFRYFPDCLRQFLIIMYARELCNLLRLLPCHRSCGEKMASNNSRRPKFAYYVPSTAAKQVVVHLKTRMSRSWPCSSVVWGTFAGSKRAATAKKQKRTADLKTAPKPENKNYNHFTPISGQGSANLLLKKNSEANRIGINC